MLSNGLYVGTLYEPPVAILKKYDKLIADVLLDRAWLQRRQICGVFHFSRIASLVRFDGACRVGALSFALKRHGVQILMQKHWLHSLPAKLRGMLLRFMRENARQLVDIGRSQGPMDKSKAKVLTLYRAFERKIAHKSALDYLTGKARKMKWCYVGTDPASVWLFMQNRSQQMLSPYARVNILRMFSGEENDDHLNARCNKVSREGECCDVECFPRPICHYKPFGLEAARLNNSFYCHRHLGELEWAWLDGLTEQTRTLLAETCGPLPQAGLPGVYQMVHDVCHNPCVLCHRCENSTEHWLTYCPVVLGAMSIMTRRYCTQAALCSYSDATVEQVSRGLTALHLVHQVRILLHARAGVNWKPGIGRAEEQARPVFNAINAPQHLAVKFLVRCTWQALPKLYKSEMCPVKVELDQSACGHTNGITTRLPPTIVPMAHTVESRLKHLVVAATPHAKGSTLATVGSTSTLLTRLWSAPQRRQRPNVVIAARLCECGNTHQDIVATRAIDEGELIAADLRLDATEANTWVVQFDGSFKGPTGGKAGGGGVVIYETGPKGAQIICAAAVPLPDAKHAGDAEAGACLAAAKLIAQQYRMCKNTPDQIFVQGDNLPIIHWWLGIAKISNSGIALCIEAAEHIVRLSLPQLKWEYIPREANKVADHLANVGAEQVLALKARQNGARPEEDSEEEGARNNITHHIIPRSLLNIADCWAYACSCNTDTTLWLVEQISDGVDTMLPLAVQRSWAKAIRKYVEHACPPPVDEPRHNLHFFSSDLAAQRMVQYRAKNPTGKGRMTAKYAAQGMHKEARLYLFGQDHIEVDLELAHWHIFIKLLKTAQIAVPPLLTGKVQNLADACIARSTAKDRRSDLKDFLYRVLNTDGSCAHRGASLLFPTEGSQFLNKFVQEHKTLAYQTAVTQFGYQADARETDSNRIYFALEHVEATVVKKIVLGIVETRKASSVIWLHDGVWAAGLSIDALRKIVDDVLEAVGLPLEVRITSLSEAYQALLQVLHEEVGKRGTPCNRRTTAALKRAAHVSATALRDLGTEDYRAKVAKRFHRKC